MHNLIEDHIPAIEIEAHELVKGRRNGRDHWRQVIAVNRNGDRVEIEYSDGGLASCAPDHELIVLTVGERA